MAPKRVQQKSRGKKSNVPNWMLHDIYWTTCSSNRIVTRSQTGFARIENTPSDVELFADAQQHQPPGMPHLMEVMKGPYGAIPRTVITRSYGQHMEVDKELIDKLKPYKDYEPE